MCRERVGNQVLFIFVTRVWDLWTARFVTSQTLGAEGFPVVFLHPKETGGVLLELLEETASS